MNREIKFRAWDKGRDVMGKVGAMDWCSTGIISAHLCYENGEVVKVYPEKEVGDDIEFMQYTGLKDKNGIEIYEGDVVFAEKYLGFENLKSEIIFNRTRFCLNTGTIPEDLIPEQVEIIGNIYENPELLTPISHE